MINVFVKDKKNIKVVTFQDSKLTASAKNHLESFEEFKNNNDIIAIVTSDKEVFKYRLNVNIFLTSTSNVPIVSDYLQRILISKNIENKLEINRACKLVDTIHSKEVNSSRVENYFPAILETPNLLELINKSREETLMAIKDGVKVQRKVTLAFFDLKLKLGLQQ
mgnify:CR=1 FL=1